LIFNKKYLHTPNLCPTFAAQNNEKRTRENGLNANFAGVCERIAPLLLVVKIGNKNTL
jgi:hypothetical protein